MRKTTTLVIVSIALLLSVIVSFFAVPTQVTAQQPNVDCSKPMTPPEMRFCAAKSYQEADRKLNQAYKQVNSSLKGEQRRLLTTAQQNWIRFRDNNCDFEVFEFRGAGDYTLFRNECLERLTEQRTKDLRDYLNRGS
jgi:uncharacterized protein YecT (DUF1311 family)